MLERLHVLSAVVVILGIASAAGAVLWRYPEDFEPGAGIQDAIQNPLVHTADTISVLSGTEGSPITYYENLDFLGKNILLASRQDPADPRSLDDADPSLTVIDGEGGDIVVRFQSGETNGARIRGFTIRNGPTGISVNGTSPSIQNNIITDNGFHGIECTGNLASPVIEDNKFRHNCHI